MSPDAVAEWALEGAYDLAASLAPHRFGARDPGARLDARAFCRATRTPEGPASLRLAREGSSLRLEAWGPGAAYLVARGRAIAGLEDAGGFEPPPGPIAALHRRSPGLRLSRAPWIFEGLVSAIVQQRVAFPEAFRGYAALFRVESEPAPGPLELALPVAPRTLARLSSAALVERGIDRRRAEALRSAAMVARRVDELADQDDAAARARLAKLPGVGPWTVESVLGFTRGDPDALITGDFHLPNVVAWNLAREPRADDARMRALLEPYAGHRFRVIRLLELGGEAAPRHGPRLRPPGR